jgi:subtilase family serine protease
MEGNSSFCWTPSSPGSYSIKFTVDCDNTISEKSETNNSVSVNVTVPESSKPELTTLYIAYDKNVMIGKQINFVPFVSNDGGTSGGFMIKWEVNGGLQDYRSHSGISANTGVSDTGSQFSWTPTSPGNYTIAFTLDCDNAISEDNESNNTISVTVVVAENAMPDLAPLSISYDPDITAGEQVFFDTGAANLGNGAASAFAVKWEVNGIQIYYGAHDGLPAFANVTDGNSLLYWTPSAPGYYTVTFTVDSDNSISEKNESNNQVSVTVYVKPVPPPSPQSIAISHSSLTIGVGQGVGVLAAYVLPAESDTTVTWLSLNNGVATISGS